jgi:magnesium chelatase subunit D
LNAPASVGIVALDEGMMEDEFAPASLLDRLAFLLDFHGFDARSVIVPAHDAAEILAARRLLPQVQLDDEVVRAICAAAAALGAGSVRITLLALHAARIAAALDGRTRIAQEDAVTVARLVLAPRASIVPATQEQAQAAQEQQKQERQQQEQERREQEQQEQEQRAESRAEFQQDQSFQNEPPPAPPSDTADPAEAADPANSAGEKPEDQTLRATLDEQQLQDLVLAAAQAAIPSGLLARLRSAAALDRASRGAMGRVGALRKGGTRGRPAGVRSGMPGGSRLNVLETLRAAAPWQRIRGRVGAGDDAPVGAKVSAGAKTKLGAKAEVAKTAGVAKVGEIPVGRTTPDRRRVRIQPEDFRVTRYKQRSQTLTIFAVDASGSAALNRLAEAKGAVELLLADCYIRRDQVAVIAFRGRTAELLLPPTRSLVRAKRSLAGLPGGGGTPLATAIDSAAALAAQARRRGATVSLVLLTDGRANVSRSGAPGRDAAHADALVSARAFGAARIAALFVDTSPRANTVAQELARRMNATYVPLPFANAQSLSKIVMAASRG